MLKFLLVELCSTHAEEVEHTIKNSSLKTRKKETTWENLNRYKRVDWIHKEAYQWGNFVNTIMNLRIQ